MKIRVIKRLLMATLVTLSSYSYADDKPLNMDAEGFLLHGYDPVAYFKNEPSPGKASYTASHDGMNFRFSSAENRQLFIESPESYLPAYGGYCAFGVRMGNKFDIDPEAYEVRDGQLYVMLNRATEKLWLEDADRNIEIANNLWPSIESVSPELLESRSQ